LAEVARDRLTLAVDSDGFRVVLNRDLQLAVNFLGASYSSAYDCEVAAEADGVLRALCTKGFSRGEQIDGFEPVGLPLTILAKDDVEARPPLDPTAQIPEAVHLK
jgi:hypothetical protein